MVYLGLHGPRTRGGAGGNANRFFCAATPLLQSVLPRLFLTICTLPLGGGEGEGVRVNTITIHLDRWAKLFLNTIFSSKFLEFPQRPLSLEPH